MEVKARNELMDRAYIEVVYKPKVSYYVTKIYNMF